MFISTSIGNLNTDVIKSYRNRWKKNSVADGQKYPGYTPNGCVVEFLDGVTSILEEHLDIPSPEMSFIIRAFPGSVIIQHCEDKAGEIQFLEYPIIAWRIDEDAVIPISPESSWDNDCNSAAIMMKNDPRVFTYENHIRAIKK